MKQDLVLHPIRLSREVMEQVNWHAMFFSSFMPLFSSISWVMRVYQRWLLTWCDARHSMFMVMKRCNVAVKGIHISMKPHETTGEIMERMRYTNAIHELKMSSYKRGVWWRELLHRFTLLIMISRHVISDLFFFVTDERKKEQLVSGIAFPTHHFQHYMSLTSSIALRSKFQVFIVSLMLSLHVLSSWLLLLYHHRHVFSYSLPFVAKETLLPLLSYCCLFSLLTSCTSVVSSLKQNIALLGKKCVWNGSSMGKH